MGARPGTNSTVDDLDYIGKEREERYSEWGTAEVLTEHTNLISTGTALDAISELGHLHRQLLQESDFHAVGRSLLKKLTPDEENERFGFNASYLPEETKVLILAIEEMGLGTSSFKSAIKLAGEDKSVINWVTENWETFIEIRPQDAMATADNGLVDVKDSDNPIHPDEKIEKDEGYQKDSYRYVEVFHKSIFKEAAERRKVHLPTRLRDIQKGQYPQDVEDQLNRNREVYNEDKILIKYWSPVWKTSDRADYLDSLHRRRQKQEELKERNPETYKKEILDFEAIRRKVWFCFDREREEKCIETEMKAVKPDWMSHVNSRTGKIREDGFRTNDECLEVMRSRNQDPRKVVIEKIITSPAIWDVEKSKDFCDLIHTSKQWNRVYEYTWEKMSETILWRLHVLKNYREGVQLCNYIRRYQFRIDTQKLGLAILAKAKKAQTEKGRDFIRLLLASCQYQLDKKIVKQIVGEISRRRI